MKHKFDTNMSNVQSDKFLLVDAKTAAKQADDIKAKQDAKLKEELAKKQAEALMKIKVEIAGYVNRAIDDGKRETFFRTESWDDELETTVATWLESLGYSISDNFDVTGNLVKISW
jgi:hypothetical protein